MTNPSASAPSRSPHRPGSLTVVGTGIGLGQATLEARSFIESSDPVLYLVTNPAAGHWIRSLNPRARSLEGCYRDGEQRSLAYRRMVQRVVAAVRRGQDVCLVLYGHPGVFVNPSHVAVRRLRREGYRARMLPGVSAEDCLFADLGIDPAEHGCQSFEATDFLVNRRIFDPTSNLVLWQVGAVGDLSYRSRKLAPPALKRLVERLEEHYPRRHEVVLYLASELPVIAPQVRRFRLEELRRARPEPLDTLYLPPLPAREPDRTLLAELARGRGGPRKRARP